MSELWLQQNSLLEKTIETYKREADQLVKKVREVHKERKALQEAAQPDLLKLTMKRDQSTLRRLQCQAAIVRLENELDAKGFNFDEYLQSQSELQKRKADPNNSAYNSTVREYETVNESQMEVEIEDVNEEDQDDEENDSSALKKTRKVSSEVSETGSQ